MKEEAFDSVPEGDRKKIEGLRAEADKLIEERDKYLNGAESDERDMQAGKRTDSVGPETLRAEAKKYEDQARQKLNEAEKEWSATDKKLFFEKNPNSTPEQYEKHVKEVKPDFETPQR